ncbi:MAG: type III-A CRISPR-associated protein Cas10/Csm1, partial [Phototrophicales bacterium]
CVPSAFYRSNPDISLYDHSRVTGAIAACIADLSDTLVVDLLQKLNNKTPDKEHTIAYMLVGDVSGVQQFIYTITAKGAASALRGRSFYIQSLTDAVAYYTLQLMNLPLTNLIYSGGGNFIVLIPAQEHSRLEELQSHLDEILITAHGSDLYVAIGATPLTCQDFQIDNFHEVWKRAFRAVGHAKRQRFSTLPPLDLYKKVFQPQGLGGDDQLECQVTHYEGKDVKPVKVGEDQFVRKSRMVRDLEALGQDLRTASGMLIVITPPDAQALDYSEEQGLGVRNVLRALGYHVYFYANSSEEEIHLPETINYSFVAGLKDLPSAQAIKYFRTRLSSSVPLIPIMRFMANVMPSEKDGKIKDFSQLAKESEGIQRLGVLRMDVDDLGKLFVDGFKHDNSGNNNDDKKGKNLSTLARVSSLSFAMQLYFEGWVGHLCEQKHNIYTVYSGGDDLFIVGTWHSVLELATEIREDFQRFCGSVATLSGGLSLHGAKEPLYQAAEIAHDALDLAKDLPNKDGFTLFRYPLKWAHFSEVLKQAEILQNIVKDTQGNRRILQILLQMHELYQELRPLYAQVEDEKEIVWGPYMWRASYLLYRLYERTKVREIESIRQQLQENNFTNL